MTKRVAIARSSIRAHRDRDFLLSLPNRFLAGVFRSSKGTTNGSLSSVLHILSTLLAYLIALSALSLD